jgi:hypothetical protein
MRLLFASSKRSHQIPTLSWNNRIGTLNQACAWARANPMVVEHVSLMTTMSDYRQNFIGLKFRDRLSVADAIVLVHRFELQGSCFCKWSWPLALPARWHTCDSKCKEVRADCCGCGGTYMQGNSEIHWCQHFGVSLFSTSHNERR